jgi:hypothetical protein
MDVDSLIVELRAAIIRRTDCATELAKLGIDPEETEREQNLRASRAIFHPANVRHQPEDGETKRTVGFSKPSGKKQTASKF